MKFFAEIFAEIPRDLCVVLKLLREWTFVFIGFQLETRKPVESFYFLCVEAIKLATISIPILQLNSQTDYIKEIQSLANAC